MEHKKCLICSSDNLKKMDNYLEGNMFSCHKCNFVFASKIPTEEDLIKHYEGYGRNDYLSPVTVNRYHEILDTFEKYRKTNNLIDVGCGIGLFAEVAIKRGWNVYGTEYTDEAIAINENKGIKMKQGKLNPLNYEPNFFDIITSFEVIEHINNPIEEINNFHNILREGGLVYITTPNFNSLSRYILGNKWTVISYPEHLSYYTAKTLHKLMKKINFKKSNVQTTGFSLTRHKIAASNVEKKYIAADTEDEILRNKMEYIWYWKLIKSILNFILNVFRKGDKIKVYYVKQ